MENEILETYDKEGKLITITGKFSYQTYPLNDKAIFVSDDDLEAIRNKFKCFDLENNCVVDYDNTEDKEKEKLEMLRIKRKSECFSIINRGKLWYDKLNTYQIEELDDWYRKWLDVTDTLTEPTKPSWLK